MIKMSIWDTAKYIQSTGGLFKFYRGSSVMAVGCIPAHSIFFSIYELSRKFMGLNMSQNINFWANALTGVMSSAFHDFILNPCDGKIKNENVPDFLVIKQRSQIMSNQSYKQILHSIIKDEGIISL